jgi:hypothetical protein
MTRNKALIGAALVAVAVAIYFVFLAGSDEEKVRAVVQRLAHAVEVRPDDTNALVRAARMKRALEDLVDEDVRLSVPELGARQGRQGLVELGAMASAAYSKVTIDPHDVAIKLDPSKTTAKVGGRVTASGTTGMGEDRRDERAFDLLMRKENGSWKVTSITVWPPGEER